MNIHLHTEGLLLLQCLKDCVFHSQPGWALFIPLHTARRMTRDAAVLS